jgi:outer membrane protein TolC
MKPNIFYGMILILLSFQFSNAQTITIKEFLESVEQNHPFFEKESLSTAIQIKEHERFLGSQDWNIKSSPYYIHQKPLGSSAFSPEQIDKISGDIALEKAFWSTGGRVSVSWTSDYTDQNIPDMVIPFSPEDIVIPAGPSKIYTNKLYLLYSQPLLQNFGGKLDRLNYELSQYNIDFTEIQVLENQEGFVLDLGMNFLDWTLLSEQKRIANERLNLAQKQLQQTRRKRQANLVDKVDVLRAEDAARIAKQNIVLIQSQFKSKQAELAVLAQSQELYNLNPEFDLYTLETLSTLDDAVSQLKEKSRILRALGTRREQLSHLNKGYTETKRPQLYLSVGAGLQSGDEEFSNSFDLDKPDVLVALDFRYPLGNRTAKADIAKTDLELIQIEKDIENVSLNLEAGVRNLLISIKEMEKVLVLNQEQIESAKAKTKEELRLYNHGRGILTFVIQSRDNEEQAKLTYAQNAANYHKLILQYRALMDELFTK